MQTFTFVQSASESQSGAILMFNYTYRYSTSYDSYMFVRTRIRGICGWREWKKCLSVVKTQFTVLYCIVFEHLL